ncbi:MAG TPA: hypothetical protein VEA38_23810 [Terriglobales bacterium]|nr:hypothetical protein [Terriglobales bacterium]
MIRRISASFVFILAFLTVLGHACELPIGILAAHAHEDAHDSSSHHHHGDDGQIQCDEVVAVRPSAEAPSSVDLDVHRAPHPVLTTPLLHAVALTPPHADVGHERPPLFLLHAALLI